MDKWSDMESVSQKCEKYLVSSNLNENCYASFFELFLEIETFCIK